MEQEEIRVWFDACLDMPHFGHANALRQAKQLGDTLIVGIHCDEEIVRHKGPPVYNTQERYRLARAMRWVDQVVEDVPYVTYIETMDKHGCQICAHGDDLTTGADGIDSYKAVKDAGRFREFSRTLGISTTDLIGRLLRASAPDDDEPIFQSPYTNGSASGSFFSTSMLANFHGNDRRQRRRDDKVVYVAGAFDLFHVGHLAFLEAAKAKGTYLIVGIHDNGTVSTHKGQDRPFLSLYERALGVLAYRVVDEVIIGAPYKVTANLLDSLNIQVVCRGKKISQGILKDANVDDDPYVEAKRRGIFTLIEGDSPDVTTESLLQRIASNAEKYRERNRKKEAKEFKLFHQQNKLANVQNASQQQQLPSSFSA